ncbi:MAG: IcmT/TraK family protein [Halothiobacillaceae bacterium]
MNGNHWRYTAVAPRFLMVDATAAYSLLLFLFHMRTWTLLLSMVSIVALWLLERRGMSPKGALNYARAWVGQWLGGGVRAETAWFSMKRRNFR